MSHLSGTLSLLELENLVFLSKKNKKERKKKEITKNNVGMTTLAPFSVAYNLKVELEIGYTISSMCNLFRIMLK